MTPRVISFNRLRQAAAGSAYERWVRDVDYPKARAIPEVGLRRSGAIMT